MGEEEKQERLTPLENAAQQLDNGPTGKSIATESESTAEPEHAFINNDQPETQQQMEVHHHAHHEHGKRNWKSYFWEFLMLFLAVFCGFLAEYQLEHVIEHQREKEYISSFLEDLKQDSAKLTQIVTDFDAKIQFKDSLLTELGNPNIFKNSSKAYYFFEQSRHFPDFIYTDRTIQQLKNSGGMRLLRNKAVSDSIIEYDASVRYLFIGQNQLNNLVLTYGFQKNKLFQIRLLDSASRGFGKTDIPLLTQKQSDVEEFYNSMWDQRKFFIWVRNVDAEVLARGKRLIAFIKKEYHLE
jgi:hypothetical protein